tara:strand:- start:123 stop:302 length:180 start_codon:yes stop_codon:yes gene_type:complete
MRVPGSKFGDPKGDNTCYVPVFRSPFESSTQWTMGTLFLEKYYMVLDQTPKNERDLDYI